MLNTILNYLQNVQNCIGKEAYTEAWTYGLQASSYYMKGEFNDYCIID